MLPRPGDSFDFPPKIKHSHIVCSSLPFGTDITDAINMHIMIIHPPPVKKHDIIMSSMSKDNNPLVIYRRWNIHLRRSQLTDIPMLDISFNTNPPCRKTPEPRRDELKSGSDFHVILRAAFTNPTFINMLFP